MLIEMQLESDMLGGLEIGDSVNGRAVNRIKCRSRSPGSAAGSGRKENVW